MTGTIDASVRAKATDDFSSSWSVEASAGTGKTTLLATRFVRILEKKLGTLSSIVAITFTEKAAFELRQRIEKLIEESPILNQEGAVIGGNAENARSARGALATCEGMDPDRAPPVREGRREPLLQEGYVSTIHAFCARLLRENAIEAGLDPEFTFMDPLTTGLFLRKAFYRWLGDLAEPSPVLRALDAGIRLDRIFDVAVELYEHRDLAAQVPAGAAAPDARAWLAGTAPEVFRLFEKAQRHCVNPHDAGFGAIEGLAAFFEAARDLPDAELEKAVLHRLVVTYGKGAQKDWSPPTALKEQKESLKVLQAEAQGLQSGIRAAVFAGLVGALRSFVARVESEKRARSWVDFDDLLFLTRDLLRASPAVLARLRAQFTHVLVDEYQDTDPVQAEIVAKLAAGEDGETPAPGKLFLVGDPKQSIYRFRKASIETYRATTAPLTARGARLVIAQNFRSSAGVVGKVNDVFAKAYADAYEPLIALASHGAAADERPLVILRPPAEHADLNAAGARRQEAAAIAAHVANLLADGKPRVWDKRAQKLRAAVPGDVAVLFPTTTGMDLFEEAFREAEVPYSLEGGSAFFHRLEIHGLLAALRASLAPRDPVAVVAALKSVTFGFSDADLYAWKAAGGKFDALGDHTGLAPPPTPPERLDVVPPFAEAFAVIREVHETALTDAPRALALLMERAFVVPISLVRFHGEQAAANVLKLGNLARHLAAHGHGTVRRFLAWVDETLRDKPRESEALLNEGDHEHVRFMTIHASKGLEFPIVVLANLTQGSHRSEVALCDRSEGWIELGIGSQDRRFATPGYEARLEAEKQAKEDEKSRLLYVAMTRAKDALIVSKYVPDPARSPYWRLLDDGFAPGDPAIEEKTVAPVAFTPRVRPAGATIDAPALLRAWEAQRAGAVPPPIAADGGRLQEREAVRLGQAFHRVMEKIDLVRPDPERWIPGVAQALGLKDQEETLRGWFARLFGMPIWGEIQAAREVGREVPFLWRGGDEELEGTIDLIFRAAKGWKIVDFKTDRRFDDPLGRAAAYREQLELYKRAAEKFVDAPVVECVLAYVHPGTEVRF